MRKMKKAAALFMAAAMAASLSACGGGSSTGTTTAPTQAPAAEGSEAEGGASADVDTSSSEGLDDVDLIGADNTSKRAAGQLFGALVAAKVDEITGGKLTIDYHPNSELGDDGDILRQMQSNDIQIVVCQTAPLVSFVPEAAVFDLPMVFSKYDGDTIDGVLNGDSAFRTELSSAFDAAGFHYLGILQNATYRLTTANKELNTLADFKALQIRTMNNSNHMAFWTAIGAEPTPLAWSEVYFALQSGTIDAQENAADTCVGANLNEVQKVLACTNHILYANQMTINKEAYDSLDPAYQAALNQAVTEALAELRPQLSEIDEQNKQTLVDKGMTLIEYDNAFYDEILNLDTVKKLYSDIDSQVNGLGSTLQEALESASK